MIHLASNGSRKRAGLKSHFSGDGRDEEKKRFGQCNRIVSRNHPTPRSLDKVSLQCEPLLDHARAQHRH